MIQKNKIDSNVKREGALGKLDKMTWRTKTDGCVVFRRLPIQKQHELLAEAWAQKKNYAKASFHQKNMEMPSNNPVPETKNLIGIYEKSLKCSFHTCNDLSNIKYKLELKQDFWGMQAKIMKQFLREANGEDRFDQHAALSILLDDFFQLGHEERLIIKILDKWNRDVSISRSFGWDNFQKGEI